jgi:hypothetical protein
MSASGNLTCGNEADMSVWYGPTKMMRKGKNRSFVALLD